MLSSDFTVMFWLSGWNGGASILHRCRINTKIPIHVSDLRSFLFSFYTVNTPTSLSTMRGLTPLWTVCAVRRDANVLQGRIRSLSNVRSACIQRIQVILYDFTSLWPQFSYATTATKKSIEDKDDGRVVPSWLAFVLGCYKISVASLGMMLCIWVFTSLALEAQPSKTTQYTGKLNELFNRRDSLLRYRPLNHAHSYFQSTQ